MKLICAGMGKTGTTSIAGALRILGYKVYDYEEQILYYTDEWLDLYKHGKVPDFYAMFKDVDAVTDAPCNFFFEEMMTAFPDAKVILTEREEDAWFESYKKHCETMYSALSFPMKIKFFLPKFQKICFINDHGRMADKGVFGPQSSYICRKRYRWHNDRVKAVVPADKLLVYNVKQGWEPLCEFTGKKIPAQPFPHLNVKGELGNLVKVSELGRKIAQEIRVVKVCFVAVIVALIGVVLFFLC